MTPITGEPSGRGWGGATIVRVQDRHGRGPYRPGMSARWSDPFGLDCPPWWVELGETMEKASERMVGPYHFGCAFRSWDQLTRWLNNRERRALDRLGYRLAQVTADVILADTPRQVVFGSLTPLSCPLRVVRLVSHAAEALAA